MKIKLKGLINTRDLGGIETADGRRIKPKRLIRSGALYLAKEDDLEILACDWNLKTDVDLRTQEEADEKPDPRIPGVRYVLNPIIEALEVGITYDTKALDGIKAFYKNDPVGKMQELYRELITKPWSVAHYRSFMKLVSEQEDGALLYHCSAGKDRVGTATCLILSALGVPERRIIEDYLETNLHVAPILSAIEKRFADGEIDELEAQMLRCYESVHASYIGAIYETVNEVYGGMDTFLQDVLEVNTKALRDKYLE